MALWYVGIGMALRSIVWMTGLLAAGCVPAGSAGPQDSGSTPQRSPDTPATPAAAPPPPARDIMKTPFEDDFSHPGAPASPAASGGAPEGGSSVEGGANASAVAAVAPVAPGTEPGADWVATQPGIWRIEGGRLCGEHAKNHGIWLKRTMPVNARIEFDATALSPEGDLKAEYWGDGRSFATALSYTNATSYLTIFGGWHNKFHVLARINEHGSDRKEITVDPNSDDVREKPVNAGQSYHFKVERSDGKTVRWWIDGNEMLTYADGAPLEGPGHDHFGFNDWDVKVCFDNVKVVPLP